MRSDYYSSKDGLKLEVKIHPAADGANNDRFPIICFPGLMRNADDFDGLASYFSQHNKMPRSVYAFTFRGRGRSEFDKDASHYTIIQEAEDVLAGLDAFGIAHGIFIGTSRGGMVMHLLAAMRPGAMKLGILNDIGPELDGAGLMQIRTFMERLPALADWPTATAYLRQSNGKSFPLLSDDDWLRWAKVTFKQGPKGDIQPNFDAALLDGLKALDLSEPLPTLWQQFTGLCGMDCLAIRGENSRLLTEEVLQHMVERHPRLTTHQVPDQGHAPLLETPSVLAAIDGFIGKHLKRH